MKKTKKFLSIILSVLMIISALPMTVFANDAVSYISRSWNGSKVVDTTKSVTDYELVTSSTTTFENGKYYVVNGSVTNSNRIVTNGTVHLILTDGCELNVKNGINVPSGATIFIYGQNENTGKITASTANDAAIGGNEDKNGGQIILHGGIYDLTAANAAAIGSARCASIGNITIYNGNITAKSNYGAGIGAGYKGTATNINIYGGNINASVMNGAAIGAGDHGTVNTINIYDGIISANSTGNGAGVGSGFWGSCGTINVFGGIVNTNSTGLGNSFGTGFNGSVSVINFRGGTVTAKADKNNSYSSAIDANKIFFDINTKVKYGTDEDDIKGELDYTSNDITSSLNNSQYAYFYQEKFVLNPVTYIERNATTSTTTSTYKTITDYEVVRSTTEKFEDNKYYVVIGNVDISKRITVSGTAHLILLDGKTFNANLGICVDDGNKLFIYGQCADSGVLNANTSTDINNSYSAIGASYGINAGDITISGGTIKASATNRFSAAIGGSYKHTNGRIDIYGGNITAESDSGAGIGAGYNSDASPTNAISIYGGTVKVSSYYGAGIGAGMAKIEGTNSSNHKLVAGNGGLVKLYGGNVTATSSKASAIGGTSETKFYSGGSSKTFYGNPAVLYMNPRITLKYGDDADNLTGKINVTSIDYNLGDSIDRIHCVSYSTGTPEVTHDYAPATCTSPKICNACGKKEGKSLGHSFAAANCTSPKICTRCDLELGSPLGHNWVVKECTKPRECANCGEKEDYTYGHDFRPYELADGETDVYNAKCINCGQLAEGMSYKESYNREDDLTFDDVYNHDTFKPGIKIAPINNGVAGKMVVSIDGVEVETVNADGKFTVPNCTECASKNVNTDGTMYLMLTTICTLTYPTCQNIPECIFCGNTAGKKDGHTWVDATCTEPRKCFFCDLTEGEPLGHSFTELGRLISYETCTSPAIYAAECEKCHEENGTIEVGEPLGHDYRFVSGSSDGLVKTYRCDRCDDSYTVDKTVLAAVIEIANDEYINNDIANKKYIGVSRLKFGVLIGTATLDNDSATQATVDSIATSIQNMINNLELKEYTVTVNKLVNDEVVDTYDATVNYGDMFNYEMILDENEAIYKWVTSTTDSDSKLNTIAPMIDYVVTENVELNCYIDYSNARQEDTARVVYYDKGNRVIALDYVPIGSAVSINVTAPTVAFYDFVEWELLEGDPSNVDKSGVSFRATYAPKNIEANKSTIVAIGDIKVNGKQTTTEFYDARIELTGASSYAYCDADGNILQGINGNVIFAPNNSQTIYVCAGTSNEASTSITGVIDEANRLTINAQYYIPSDCTVVEAGIVISKTNENPTVNGTGCQALKSSQQGPSGEYSISLKYSTTGTINVVSYLTYKDSNDTLHTAYSDAQAITFGA